MYSQRSTFIPEYESTDELRSVLEARVLFLQSRGLRASLNQTLFGRNNAALHTVLVFDDLGGLEQYRIDLRGTWAKFRDDLAPLVSQPPTSVLAELVVVPPPSDTVTNYALRVVDTPLAGKAAELATVMKEWATTRIQQGYRYSLGMEVAGPAAGTLIMQVAFERLEELGELRSRARDDDAAQQYLAAAGDLQAGLSISEVLQYVVPLSPRLGTITRGPAEEWPVQPTPRRTRPAGSRPD